MSSVCICVGGVILRTVRRCEHPRHALDGERGYLLPDDGAFYREAHHCTEVVTMQACSCWTGRLIRIRWEGMRGTIAAVAECRGCGFVGWPAAKDCSCGGHLCARCGGHDTVDHAFRLACSPYAAEVVFA